MLYVPFLVDLKKKNIRNKWTINVLQGGGSAVGSKRVLLSI